jgi:hypothetical protein
MSHLQHQGISKRYQGISKGINGTLLPVAFMLIAATASPAKGFAAPRGFFLEDSNMMRAAWVWADVPEVAHLFAEQKRQAQTPDLRVKREIVAGGCVVLRLKFGAARKA